MSEAGADEDDGVGVSTPDSPQRDDLGRGDEDPGFVIQARIFAAIGLWLIVISIVYGAITGEYAGTTLLAVSSLLVFTIAAYVGWRKPPSGTSVHAAEHGDGPEEPWFPLASGWPFALAFSMALFGNGLLLGQWLLAPAAALLIFSIGGFVAQSRARG